MSIFGAKWSESSGKSAIFDLGKSVKSKGIIAVLKVLLVFEIPPQWSVKVTVMILSRDFL